VEWVTSESVATAERAAAEFIAQRLVLAVRERRRGTLAISGGRSPWGMFAQLAALEVPWTDVHLFQVDERIVPLAHAARNWKQFLENPLARLIPRAQQHPMPVESDDAEAAAAQYAETLAEWNGEPPTLDLVHLGIGADGHTASLFADDAALEESTRSVAVSRVYENHRRLTLTLPVLNRARSVVWFAVGAERRGALTQLFSADPAIVATRVQRDHATCFTDREAAPAT
jgi:6-phosphogluconolactonase